MRQLRQVQVLWQCLILLGGIFVGIEAKASDLIISGVIDGPLTGGLPKAVELYVVNDIADLSRYGLGSANNGEGTDGEEFTFPAAAITGGNYIYIASENIEFNNFFGFSPDYVSSTVNINGDDAIELFQAGNVVDVFGDINNDGTGQAWEYMDGWAYRKKTATTPLVIFNVNDWNYSGRNVLDGETSNAAASTAFPQASYSSNPAPSITLIETDGITSVNEAGSTTDTYSLALNSTPASPVTLMVSTAADEIEVSNDGTTFDSSTTVTLSNTSTATITVKAVDDVDSEGTHTSTVSHAITTGDGVDYVSTLSIDAVTVTIVDNDAVGGWVINEIHADPASDLSGDANGDGSRDASHDEFVEIINNTGVAVDITAWTLSDSVGIKHIFPANSIIPNGCGVVIFGGGDLAGLLGKMSVHAASSGELGLNNTGDTITLNDGNTNVVSVTYDSTAGADQALSRVPDLTGLFVKHSTTSNGNLFSPGTQIDGTLFSGCDVAAEPSNSPTAFTATADSSSQITTSWIDATGTQLPAGYLVVCATSDSLSAPIDGTAYPDDIHCADGNGLQNITPNMQTVAWTGLADSTSYFFKVFPYSNSGASIDYKTDVTASTAEATTDALAASTCNTASPVTHCIHDIQGHGSGASPLVGNAVTVEGVVTAVFPGLKGFFIQEETSEIDAAAASSEGVFVYMATTPAVNVGDKVQVAATVNEYKDNTQLAQPTVTIVSSGHSLPVPVSVNLPLASDTEWERYEGMYVTFPQTLYITSTRSLTRYGTVELSSGSRLQQPTNVLAPGPAATALQAHNALNRILLDDGITTQNVVPTPYGFTANNTIRGGDTLTGLTGIIDYRFNAYRLQKDSNRVNFTASNPRPSTPTAVGGTLKVASFNVLNYFSTLDASGSICGPARNQDCRGANSAAEFTRQRDKIIAAITTLDADIIGLMEVENTTANSGLQDLVQGLNAVAGAGQYAFINSGTIGRDVIRVALIYKPATVSTVGSHAILDDSVTASFTEAKNRPVLAQTFAETATGERFTVAVVHFKAKGSDCDSLGDPDVNDGQGNCNLTRNKAATALKNWLATDPTHSNDADFLLMGDFNAYAKEDPITTLETAGYTNQATGYSFSFAGQWGALDHILTSSALTPQVTGATKWHINADEPAALDYNLEYKSTSQQSSLYNADVYRSSDHDPIIIGLALASNYALTLATTGSGTGTVSSSSTPVGISCGTNCLSYRNTDNITLSATPNGGSDFNGWSCDNQFSSGNKLTANTTCTATFTAAPHVSQYRLLLQTDGNGSGTLSGTAAGTYSSGSHIHLTATADTASVLVAWTPATCASPFSLTADTTCTATFATRPVTPPPVALDSTLDLAPVLIETKVELEPEEIKTEVEPEPEPEPEIEAETTLESEGEIEVTPPAAPQLQHAQPDITVPFGTASQTHHLSSYFSSVGNDSAELRYHASSSNPHIVTAHVTGSDLHLTFHSTGYSNITVTATAANGLSAHDLFAVNVSQQPTFQPVSMNAYCRVRENFRGNCNVQGRTLTIRQNNGVIGDAVIDSALENTGWLLNSVVTANGSISGGILSGSIINKGIIQDVDFRGRVLQGGTLGGTIRNNSAIKGLIQNVRLLPNTHLIGGTLDGTLQGDPLAPAKLDSVKIKTNAVLSHVIIDDDIPLPEGVTLGEGVRFASEFPCINNGIRLSTNTIGQACFVQQNQRITITPESAHRGQSAELIWVAVNNKNNAYSHDGHYWQQIPVEPEQILTAKPIQQLPFTITTHLPVNSTNTPFVAVFVGYRLNDGEVVYILLES